MTPLERYKSDLTTPGFKQEPSQLQAVESLSLLHGRLNQPLQNKASFIQRLIGKVPPTPGIYLVGPVGRGKTYLMDLFYDCLEGQEKKRVHYHRFMLDIHEKLKYLPRSPDPLPIIAKEISDQVQVLCLDEFHVTDVADAMLLTGLLKALFKNGVTLVATSNTRIDNLYLNGLQRERFMSAIHLLKDYTVEIDLGQGADYRLLHLEKGGTYKLEKENNNKGWLKQKFTELSPSRIHYAAELDIQNRVINTIAISEDVVWFEFAELCDTPRAAQDYLEIARQFHTVVVSSIPVLLPARDSAAKRFMHLIDALYDHRVKLIATAEETPEQLYQGNLLKGMFERTVSRLIEMASHDYLAMAHRP